MKPTLLYHQGAAGSDHEAAHKLTNLVKGKLDRLRSLPPSEPTIVYTAQGVQHYHNLLHFILQTNDKLPKEQQADHPEEQAELDKLHFIIQTAIDLATMQKLRNN